jgi:hypothetical protein
MTFVASTVAALVAKLAEAPAVSPVIGRVRLRPLAQNVTTAVVVRPVASEVQGTADIATGYPVSWRGVYHVECYARASALEFPDAAVDGLLQAVYARIFADPFLGGAVIQLEPVSVSFDFDADGDQTACAVLTINAHHATAGASL